MELYGRCAELASPNLANFIISMLLLVGMIISYLPQHIRIIRRRSSEGLSPYFVLLGTVSGTCAIANILLLPTSRADMDCCRVISPLACTAGLLGIAQIGLQWACFFVITMLFLAFIPRHAIDQRHGEEIPLEPTDSNVRQAITVVVACIFHFILTLIVSVVVMARYPDQIGTLANFLGLASTTIASIQYLPQIWTTWKLQEIGSLSIPMMCLQTPGAFILAASLANRLGADGWSAWLVYVVTGALQGVLLVMAVYFDRRNRRIDERHGSWQSSDPDDEAGAPPEETAEYDDENTPLLHERQRLEAVKRMQDAQDHPLAPHRLDPGPESGPSSEGSDPITIVGADGADDSKDKTEDLKDPKNGRRTSKARWAKGDFSFRVW